MVNEIQWEPAQSVAARKCLFAYRRLTEWGALWRSRFYIVFPTSGKASLGPTHGGGVGLSGKCSH